MQHTDIRGILLFEMMLRLVVADIEQWEHTDLL